MKTLLNLCLFTYHTHLNEIKINVRQKTYNLESYTSFQLYNILTIFLPEIIRFKMCIYLYVSIPLFLYTIPIFIDPRHTKSHYIVAASRIDSKI